MNGGRSERTSELPLGRQLEQLRRRLRTADPVRLAQRAGALWDPVGTCLRLCYWDVEVSVPWPQLEAIYADTGARVPVMGQALVAYYLSTTDGTPPAGRLISFADLPDGRFYAQAFQGYTSGPLATAFGDDLAAFARAARSLGATPLQLGDATYGFTVLPHVHVAVVAWQGDEEFSSSWRILFDAAVVRHLPTDACAIVGGALTRRLIAAGQEKRK